MSLKAVGGPMVIGIVALVVMAVVGYFVITGLQPAPNNLGVLNVSVKDLTTSTFSSVVLTFSSVRVHESGVNNESGWHNLSLSTHQVDLLKVKNVSQLLGSTQLNPGMYEEVDLTVSNISATFASNGTKISVYLYVNIVKTTQTFKVNATKVTSYTVDIDLTRSFVEMPWGTWYFLPVLGPVVVQQQ